MKNQLLMDTQLDRYRDSNNWTLFKLKKRRNRSLENKENLIINMNLKKGSEV